MADRLDQTSMFQTEYIPVMTAVAAQSVLGPDRRYVDYFGQPDPLRNRLQTLSQALISTDEVDHDIVAVRIEMPVREQLGAAVSEKLRQGNRFATVDSRQLEFPVLLADHPVEWISLDGEGEVVRPRIA